MIADKGLFLSQSKTDDLVVRQLGQGIYRSKEDSAPSDWVVRVWKRLPRKEAGWVATAVCNALNHPDPNVRSEAQRALDIAPKMRQ